MGVGQEDQVTGSFRRLSDRNATKPIPLLAVMVLMVVTVVVLIEFIMMAVTSVVMERKKEKEKIRWLWSLCGWLVGSQSGGPARPADESQTDQTVRGKGRKFEREVSRMSTLVRLVFWAAYGNLHHTLVDRPWGSVIKGNFRLLGTIKCLCLYYRNKEQAIVQAIHSMNLKVIQKLWQRIEN